MRFISGPAICYRFVGAKNPKKDKLEKKTAHPVTHARRLFGAFFEMIFNLSVMNALDLVLSFFFIHGAALHIKTGPRDLAVRASSRPGCQPRAPPTLGTAIVDAQLHMASTRLITG